MEYISSIEAARKWGVTDRQVQRLLHEGRVPGARKYGVAWFLPADAEKPEDPRRARRRESAAVPSSPHLLPQQCPQLAMTTIYGRPGSADAVVASLKSDPNAQALFCAQLAYFRGQPETAAKLSHALLSETSCFDTRLGCLVNLANIALYTGSHAAWSAARAAVAETPCRNESERTTAAYCLAAIDSALYDRRSYPDWLRIGCFDTLPIDAFPAARYYFFKYLAISRASIDTVSMLEPLCSQTRAEGAVIAELYQRLIAVIGHHDSGSSERANYHLNRALDLALPDGLYAPLAEARRNIGVMLDDALRARDPAALRVVTALSDRLLPAWTSIYQKRMQRPFAADLTIREHEVIKYAASGLTNDEIAATLHLSRSTVKSHISAALQKTGLRDRSELAAYLSMS